MQGPAAVGARDLALAVVHHDDVADGLELVDERPEQADQRPVDEDHLVLGVVDDVDELLGEQPDVQRVQHPAGARDGEVELEVAGRVPGEGGHPAVVADAEVVEHAAEPAGALGPVAVGGALDAGGGGGDELLVEEQRLGPPEEVRQRERYVLHQTLHGLVPLRAVGRSACRLGDARLGGRGDGEHRSTGRRRAATP